MKASVKRLGISIKRSIRHKKHKKEMKERKERCGDFLNVRTGEDAADVGDYNFPLK